MVPISHMIVYLTYDTIYYHIAWYLKFYIGTNITLDNTNITYNDTYITFDGTN